jgi:S-adenosylmethionine:tRNA ribosyltransferase-isomerase
MLVSEFDFDLPAALIAQVPPAERGRSRLLVLDRRSGAREHATVGDLPRFLRPGDLLVLNDTKVFPARLLGRRVPSGGAVECLLIARTGEDTWQALVHPGQKLRPGGRVAFEGAGVRLEGEILARHFHGRRTIRLWRPDGGAVDAAVDAIGHVPLPPYIHRPDTPEDRERYQTVYARVRGSVAAPTAGLHFTPDLLDRLARLGVERAEITLHVGYGTFKPVRAARVEDHTVDPEACEIGDAAATAIDRALAGSRRVIAVGTTTTRALEAAARPDGSGVRPGRRLVDLFIHPGHEFRVVSGLVTNFHLPRSSLLMLVCAFAGRERLLAAYREAIEQRYRFYSYGDCMLIV